jgi:hypothetical protein
MERLVLWHVAECSEIPEDYASSWTVDIVVCETGLCISQCPLLLVVCCADKWLIDELDSQLTAQYTR